MISQDQIGGTPFEGLVSVTELEPGMMVLINNIYKTIASVSYNTGDSDVLLVFDHGDYQTILSYPVGTQLTTRI